jgi:hypothetical protein
MRPIVICDIRQYNMFPRYFINSTIFEKGY